jgi:RNA recognition motif-containing protein
VQVKAIYVGNLPETVTEEKLRDVFKAYGEVRICTAGSAAAAGDHSSTAMTTCNT